MRRADERLCCAGLDVIVDLGCHRPSWAAEDAGWDAYGACVAACVERWGSTIVAIETMNEPNMDPRCFDPSLPLPKRS